MRLIRPARPHWRFSRFSCMGAVSVMVLSAMSASTVWATALEDGSDYSSGPSVPGMEAPVPQTPIQISELPATPYVAGTNNELFRQKMGMVVSYIQSYNKRLAWEDTTNIAQAIVQFSDRYGIDFRLLCSLIAIESGFRSDVVSSAGAIGMGQLKPDTAHWLGVVDPYNPVDNIAGTARFLSWLMHRYNGNLEFALSAYFQGPGFVDKNGIAPVCMPYLEKVNRALGPLM